MEETAFEQWWQLHLRVARGEPLTPKEQQTYEAGSNQFDREEREQFAASDLASLRRLRAELVKRQGTYTQLLTKSAALDGQIQTLERAFQAVTGYELANPVLSAS